LTVFSCQLLDFCWIRVAQLASAPKPKRGGTIFQKLELFGWRQFDSIDLDFHPRLTILTGANGAGKTTILNLLSRHFGWSVALLSTPRRRKGGLLQYFAGLRSHKTGSHKVGKMIYRGGNASDLLVPAEVGPGYHLEFSNLQGVSGIYIPSHRPIYFYQPVGQIPTTPWSREQLLSTYTSEYMSRYQGGGSGYSPSYRLKEAMISLATFGYGNEAVERNPEAVETFEAFEAILRTVLPKPLGFRNIRIRLPEVVLETDTGDFSVDAVSGGVAAIIDVAWQIHVASYVHGTFVVLMDEPENHLHPSLQQALLPRLLDAFPTVQFICASHNPFIVSSVPESNVYVLRFTEERSVRSEYLDTINKAGSANEILRDVLGLSFTLPLWVESQMSRVVDELAGKTVTAQDLQRIRAEMAELGFEDLYPEAVSRLLESPDDQTD
jgi:predicted ATPase